MPEKHWSEIHKIEEKREIKWEISGMLIFWGDEDQEEDFLTPDQQPTFEKSLLVLRDSLHLVFPRVSQASSRLELHRILDQVDQGFKRNRSTKAAHILQVEFEDGVFKPQAPRQKGRPPKRDSSFGEILSVEGMKSYISFLDTKMKDLAFKAHTSEYQSYFAQLSYSVEQLWAEPHFFQTRVELKRMLDEAFVEFELGNSQNGIDNLKNFKEVICELAEPSQKYDLLNKLKNLIIKPD